MGGCRERERLISLGTRGVRCRWPDVAPPAGAASARRPSLVPRRAQGGRGGPATAACGLVAREQTPAAQSLPAAGGGGSMRGETSRVLRLVSRHAVREWLISSRCSARPRLAGTAPRHRAGVYCAPSLATAYGLGDPQRALLHQHGTLRPVQQKRQGMAPEAAHSGGCGATPGCAQFIARSRDARGVGLP